MAADRPAVSAADQAAHTKRLIRDCQRLTEQRFLDAARSAISAHDRCVDALVARCEQLERERDEARRELEEQWQANQRLAQDHYFGRAEAAEARAATLETALRRIAELRVATAFGNRHDASQARAIARAALAETKEEP